MAGEPQLLDYHDSRLANPTMFANSSLEGRRMHGRAAPHINAEDRLQIDAQRLRLYRTSEASKPLVACRTQQTLARHTRDTHESMQRHVLGRVRLSVAVC